MLRAVSSAMRTVPPRLVARGLLLAGAAYVVAGLTACGGSGVTHAHANAARRAARADASSAKQASACETVSKPQPKGPQHLTRPTLRLDPAKSYVAELVTNCGSIEIKLDAGQAPAVTASFVHLVDIGFYDDLTFHRIVSGYLIQGGDPEGDGSGGPGYSVTERPAGDVKYTKGTVAMAKDPADPPGTAGSQFFIVTGSNVDLPPQYAVLGNVIGGQDTLTAMSNVPTTAGPDGEDSSPTTPIVISEATVKTSR